MENESYLCVTYIRFVDKFDQLIEQIQVAPTRTHHTDHPDQIPVNTAAYRYYDHTTQIVDGVTYHNECNHSPWVSVPQPQLASAS